MHLFLKKYRNFVFEKNKHFFKMAASMLSNCLQFLFNNSKEKDAQDMLKIFQKASPKQYKEAKLHVLESILIINYPSYFQPKMILILHMLCD